MSAFLSFGFVLFMFLLHCHSISPPHFNVICLSDDIQLVKYWVFLNVMYDFLHHRMLLKDCSDPTKSTEARVLFTVNFQGCCLCILRAPEVATILFSQCCQKVLCHRKKCLRLIRCIIKWCSSSGVSVSGLVGCWISIDVIGVHGPIVPLFSEFGQFKCHKNTLVFKQNTRFRCHKTQNLVWV